MRLSPTEEGSMKRVWITCLACLGLLALTGCSSDSAKQPISQDDFDIYLQVYDVQTDAQDAPVAIARFLRKQDFSSSYSEVSGLKKRLQFVQESSVPEIQNGNLRSNLAKAVGFNLRGLENMEELIDAVKMRNLGAYNRALAEAKRLETERKNLGNSLKDVYLSENEQRQLDEFSRQHAFESVLDKRGIELP